MCECYNNVRNVICFVILNESFYVVGTMSGKKKVNTFHSNHRETTFNIGRVRPYFIEEKGGILSCDKV